MLVAAIGAIALLAPACGAEPTAASAPGDGRDAAAAGTTIPNAAAGSAPAATTPVGNDSPLPTSSTVSVLPAFAPTTMAPPTVSILTTPSCPTRAAPVPPSTIAGDTAPPASLALANALAELNRSGASVAISVRVDGLGDIVSQNPTQLLIPASNQKLLVAAAVLEALPHDDRLVTSVVATGPTTSGGVVHGDLVLVGGGDPSLTSTAARSLHSLDALSAQLQARGITRVEGRLVVDDTRYDSARVAPGWPSNTWASNVGPLSALIVNRNREGTDVGYLNDPALGNVELFRASLTAAGITVAGPTAPGGPTAGERLASVSSMTIRELVAEMLGKSDNLTAEVLVKELGYRRSGTGSTAAGLAAAREIVAGLCVTVDGTDADGSGLSRDDRRSTSSLRSLLEIARSRPWWPILRDALPLAGRSGTLTTRMVGPSTAGNVRAKTGSTLVARSLSGYLTTAGGRATVFSILVNTPNNTADNAIDAFVTAVAELP